MKAFLTILALGMILDLALFFSREVTNPIPGEVLVENVVMVKYSSTNEYVVEFDIYAGHCFLYPPPLQSPILLNAPDIKYSHRINQFYWDQIMGPPLLPGRCDQMGSYTTRDFYHLDNKAIAHFIPGDYGRYGFRLILGRDHRNFTSQDIFVTVIPRIGRNE